MDESLWQVRAKYVQKFIQFEMPSSLTAWAAAGLLECYCGGRMRLVLWFAKRWIRQWLVGVEIRYRVWRAGGLNEVLDEFLRERNEKEKEEK